MSKPEWAQTLERIADALDKQKVLDGPTRIPGRLTVKWIKDLREIAAMDIGSLEASGICETCESEAVKRAEVTERKLRLATRLLHVERKSRPAISGPDAIRREGPRECHDCACNWTTEDRTECARTDPCDVQQQRADDTRCLTCGTSKAVNATRGWACPRCSGAWDNQGPRMSETDCPCNECALEYPYTNIAACRSDVLARDDGSCGYPEWTKRNRQEKP